MSLTPLQVLLLRALTSEPSTHEPPSQSLFHREPILGQGSNSPYVPMPIYTHSLVRTTHVTNIFKNLNTTHGLSRPTYLGVIMGSH